MGGAVQSFSSPMLAQGMQGGLSGFGTSGLQTFADGGQTTTIQDILAKYKAMESAKVKQDPTTEFLNKSWEGKNIDDYVMYSDKFKKGGKMAKGGIFEHGLQEGDKIVKQVDEKYLIVASKGGVYSVVDIEKGSRFIVGLDDSKTSGKRKSVKAGVKEAMEYINYLKSTKMANGGKFAQGGMLEGAKIYVADLAEYNNGRLVGKWLELSDYSSGAEVMEAIQEMLDEQTKKDKFGDVHEEYAIHDYEGFPRSFYSEYMGESDFDALYEMMRVADSSNLPLEVLMEAVSDLGYEDDPERVAEAYYTSIPASMGNEWRDFAYEYIDSIGSITEAVSKPEYYFDFENFGSDVRMDYSEEELEEMGYNDLSDEELGEQMADEMGGVKYLGEKLIETYFDYDKFGRELEYDFIAVRGKDGDFYFFNRNFAKGGKLKYAKGGEVVSEIESKYALAGKDSGGVWTYSKITADEIAKKYKGSVQEDGSKWYVSLNKFTKGGKVSSQKIYEVEYEIGGKKHTSEYMMYDWERVENKFPPETKIISIKEKFAKGGEVGNFKVGDIVKSNDKKDGYGAITKIEGNMAVVDFEDKVSNQIKFVSFSDLKKVSLNQFRDRFENSSYEKNMRSNKFAKGGEVGEWVRRISIPFNTKKEALKKLNFQNSDNSYKDSKIEKLGDSYVVVSYEFIKPKEFAKGGKIGFEGLAKKVAKRYVGKKVSKEYQAEYGKTYDAKEAKEVGNKVAGKVYQQQVAKKKIVRKLQRKTK